MEQLPGYWDLEIGDNPEDPDMVRGRMQTLGAAIEVVNKYSCNHVKITRVPFTQPSNL